MNTYNFKKNFKYFRQKLDLTEDDKSTLLSGRKKIRSTIRATFKEMQDKYFTKELKIILTNFSGSIDKKVKPKFLTQGSFVYNTINKPEQPPVQQMDLDDGVYLPLSYVKNESNDNFDKASEAVRNIIYACIQDLCNQMEWSLKRHSKCVRVTISDTSHIDLPIYSIPDNQLATISEQGSLGFSDKFDSDRFLSYEKNEDILLATDNGWIKSDPRVIHEWVKNMKTKHSKNFIYYSRYLKAWRDHQWKDGELSSIMIMAGIAQALSENSYSKDDNIALDISIIVNSILIYLGNGGIKDPDNLERMDGNLDNRKEILVQLQSLATNLNEATKRNDVNKLIDCFGSRFPKEEGEIASAVVMGAGIIIPPTTPAIPIRQYRKY